MVNKLTDKTNQILEFIFSDIPNRDIVEYVKERHGFVADEGAYWVLYSTDLDEYEIEVEGHKIPEGMVEIFHWAVIKEEEAILLPLQEYIHALEDHLKISGESGLINEILKISV
jgi:hypothetical protein